MNLIPLFFQKPDILRGSLLEDLFTQVVSAVPKVVMALVIFIIGWIISKFVARILKKFFEKIQIDALGEKLNDIDIVNKTNVKIVPSTFLSKIVYYIMLLIFAVAATDVLQMPAISNLMTDIIAYIPRFISALFVFVIGLLVADFIKNIVLTACESLVIPSAKLIAAFVFYFIFLSVAMTAITQMGINSEVISNNLTMILGGGVLAFALGYGIASKDMMANFLASFYSKEKFHIGDEVSIEGIRGKIAHMDSSSVTLVSEKSRIVIPLSKLSTEKVVIHEA